MQVYDAILDQPVVYTYLSHTVLLRYCSTIGIWATAEAWLTRIQRLEQFMGKEVVYIVSAHPLHNDIVVTMDN